MHRPKCGGFFFQLLSLGKNNSFDLTVVNKILFDFVECVKVVLWMLVKTILQMDIAFSSCIRSNN